jgi:HlyD family secretion protein
MKFSKTFWIIVTLVIVALIVAAKWFGGGTEATSVQTEQAKIRTIVERISASGKIQPEVEVNITAEVSGQIIALPVKEGDQVTEGDLLVQINPDLYNAALNRAEAAANSARSNLASARAQHAQADAQFFAAKKSWGRSQTLFGQGVVSQADFDNAQANFRSSEATLTSASESIRSAQFAISSAEASVQEARDNLSRTTLLAPQSGTVTALVKEIGESVQGNGFTAGEVVMKVSDLSVMEVDVEVNESDIVRVSMQDAAEIEVDAYLDETFSGEVTEIGNTALNAGLNGFAMDQVTNFSVKVRLQSESYSSIIDATAASNLSPFRPGMSAKVDILTRRADKVISIPIQAVSTREKESAENEDTELGVFVFSNGIALWKPVITGIQDNRFIEIISGLEVISEVIIGPYQAVSRTLSNEDEVEVQDDSESAEE